MILRIHNAIHQNTPAKTSIKTSFLPKIPRNLLTDFPIHHQKSKNHCNIFIFALLHILFLSLINRKWDTAYRNTKRMKTFNTSAYPWIMLPHNKTMKCFPLFRSAASDTKIRVANVISRNISDKYIKWYHFHTYRHYRTWDIIIQSPSHIRWFEEGGMREGGMGEGVDSNIYTHMLSWAVFISPPSSVLPIQIHTVWVHSGSHRGAEVEKARQIKWRTERISRPQYHFRCSH